LREVVEVRVVIGRVMRRLAKRLLELSELLGSASVLNGAQEVQEAVHQGIEIDDWWNVG